MMKGSVVSWLFVSVFLLGGCASGSHDNSFIFIQMSDTQFGFFNENRDFAKETRNFEKAVAQANRLHPAFVIVCGDLVNRAGDTAQIAEYKRIAALLDPSIKLYQVPGNHDVGNMPTPKSLETYRHNFGPDHYRFEAGNIIGLVLNSSLMRDPDSARAEAEEQDRWLRQELAAASKSPDKILVIFQHHSYFLSAPDEPDQYFNYPLAERKKYLDLFRESGVAAVFAGHYHRNAFGRAGDMQMVTTGPVGRPLGKDPSGFRIVQVDGKELIHRYYSLDSIPQVVNLR